MTNPINITINGLPCIAATCTLRAGARASTALCIVRARDAAALKPGLTPTIVFSDTATRAIIASLIVRSIVKRPDGTAAVRLADRRADWLATTSIDARDPVAATVIADLLTTLGEKPALAGLSRGTETIGTITATDSPAATILDTVLARIGQSLTIDNDGSLRALSITPPRIESPLLMRHSQEPARRPTWLHIQSGPAATQASITFIGVPVCRDEAGEWRTLTDVLTAWELDASDVAKAVFVPYGLQRLLSSTSASAEQQRIRAAILATHAWRSYRVPDDQQHHLPLIASRTASDNATLAPLIEHTGFRHRAEVDTTLADPFNASTDLTPHDGGLTLDARNGIVTFDRVTAHLAPLTPPVHHTTLEGREVTAPPTIRITASRSTNAGRTLLTRRLANDASNIDNASTAAITLGHLTPPDDSTPSNANDPSIIEASLTAARIRRALPTSTLHATLAGAHAIAPHAGASVRIHASAQSGLTTSIRPDPTHITRVLSAFATPTRPAPHISQQFGDATSPPRVAITAARLGPVIIAANTDAAGAALTFARADSIDPETGGLQLTDLAPLATPFHLPHTDTDQPGRWCLAIPVRKTATGDILLDNSTTPNADHDPVTSTPLGRTRPIPDGADGLLIMGADGESHLVLYDRPIVAQSRGDSPGAYSTEIREIVGSAALDETRRGPLQLLTVMALSPLHAAAGTGGNSTQRGWIPVLNLRDYLTAMSSEALLAGRGLFADRDGLTLGRLAHAPNHGGPIFSDADTCDKHLFGEITHGDETFRETAGHIATDAFFKLAGDAFFDGPFLFQAEETFAGPAEGLEYQAEIKFNNDHTHPFNGTTKQGRWVVTYRMPLYDVPPPPGDDWPPMEDPPVVVPRNILAPSFDWSPPGGDPSSGPGAPPEGEEDVPFRGETISSVGYAPIDIDGFPDPALGGGAFFLPRGVRLVDGSPWDYEGPRYWVTLHESVGLAFGRPNYGDAECTPCAGFRAFINDSSELEVLGVTSDGDPDADKLVRIKGALASEGTTTLAEGESALLGFFGGGPASKPVVEGSHGDIPALVSLIDALATLGLITNDTTS